MMKLKQFFIINFLLLTINVVIGDTIDVSTSISSINSTMLNNNSYVPVKENGNSTTINNESSSSSSSLTNVTTDSNANVYNGIVIDNKDPLEVNAQQQNPFLANRMSGGGGGGGINPQIAMILRNNPRLQLLAQQNPVMAQQIMRNPQLLRDPIIQSNFFFFG